MTAQSFQCARCHTANEIGAQFCSQCGSPLTHQPSLSSRPNNRKTLWITIGVLVAVIGACGWFGMIFKLSEKSQNSVVSSSNDQGTRSPSPVVAPTATPKPTFADLQQQAQPLLNLEKEEYFSDDLKAFDAVMGPLREIPKDAKEYSAAQALLKKLIDKSARITAEILVLGPKPKNSEWDGRVDPVVDYLRSNLNDYDSSEFVEWSPVAKLEVKGEPFWVVRLKLRAKNAFGGYVLKNTFYFIRQNKVVSAEGL